jgi:hypothetical protein
MQSAKTAVSFEWALLLSGTMAQLFTLLMFRISGISCIAWRLTCCGLYCVCICIHPMATKLQSENVVRK